MIESGVTRTISANLPYGACAACHGIDQTAFLNLLNKNKNDFVDSQSAVQYFLEQNGFYKRSSGFYRARDLSVITAGTVTAVNGNTAITGIKTNWNSVQLEAGDKFRLDNNGSWYTIASVDSATGITLSAPYSGTTYTASAGVGYTIVKNETVTVTRNSAVVTGTGTNWSDLVAAGALAAGDRFRVDSDGTWYTISAVDSNTQITLTSNYTGVSKTTAGFSLRNTTTALVSGATMSTVTLTGANALTLDVATLPTPTSTSGDYFRIDSDGTWYRITDRTASTLTLAASYAGSITNGAYTIIRNTGNKDWLTRGDTDMTGNTTGKNNIGAAFNLAC